MEYKLFQLLGLFSFFFFGHCTHSSTHPPTTKNKNEVFFFFFFLKSTRPFFHMFRRLSHLSSHLSHLSLPPLSQTKENFFISNVSECESVVCVCPFYQNTFDLSKESSVSLIKFSPFVFQRLQNIPKNV